MWLLDQACMGTCGSPMAYARACATRGQARAQRHRRLPPAPGRCPRIAKEKVKVLDGSCPRPCCACPEYEPRQPRRPASLPRRLRSSSWIHGGTVALDSRNITEAIDSSLRRLGVDNIDLYQIHWPDRSVQQLHSIPVAAMLCFLLISYHVHP